MLHSLTEHRSGDRHVRVASSVEELLDGATHRELWKNSDSLSGSRLERATIGGEPYVVKYTCVDDDWLMRASGDLHCRQLTLFTSDVLELAAVGDRPHDRRVRAVHIRAWAPRRRVPDARRVGRHGAGRE